MSGTETQFYRLTLTERFLARDVSNGKLAELPAYARDIDNVELRFDLPTGQKLLVRFNESDTVLSLRNNITGATRLLGLFPAVTEYPVEPAYAALLVCLEHARTAAAGGSYL